MSALDKTLRVEMQLELRRIQREVGITTIFVTHDQEEALTMSDRIGILRDGRLVQEGSPEELYHRPASVFAATFLGDANILRGSGAANTLRLADGSLVVAEESQVFDGDPTACAIRPERIGIAPIGYKSTAPNTLTARLVSSVFAGASIVYLTEWNGQPLKVFARNDGTAPIAADSIVELSWTPGAVASVKD